MSNVLKEKSTDFWEELPPDYQKEIHDLTKKKVQEQIEKFPDEFSIDELVERLILIEKVDNGLLQSEHDEIILDSDLDNEVEKCFK